MPIVFKCKMCGGDLNIQEGATIVKCLYCGSKQTLPKIDDDKRRSLYSRANYFRQNGDFDKAVKIYEQILSEDNTDAETYWSIVLCRYGVEYVEDPATHSRVPTVNRIQSVPVTSDADYNMALKYADVSQYAIYQAEAKAIDKIQRDMLEISRREKPFDVFISYKDSDNNGQRTIDSVLAVDLYEKLTQEGFKVFCSRITLEDKIGRKYEPYIFAALNSVPVMVVLGTKPEYFNAVWVRNEWSRYLTLIKNGAKKTLIPAYRDMSPYDLPDEFSHLQAQDMGKIGFMQDLIRGVKKLIRSENPKTETVNLTSGNPNAAPLLKRVFIFLEDGDFDNADNYCERVLDIDPENATAYFGKLMAEKRVKNCEDLADCEQPFDDSNNYQKVIRYGDAKLVLELKRYIADIKDRIEQNRLTNIYNQAIRLMNNGQYKSAINAFMTINDFKDSYVLIQQCQQKLEKIRLESERNAEQKRIEAEKARLEAQRRAELERIEAERVRIEAQRKAEQERIEAEQAKIIVKKRRKFILILCVVICAWFAFYKYHKVAMRTKLFEACKTGSTQEIIDAINSRVDVNVKNEDGNTALILAAYKGNAEVINALIKAGADVNAKNKNNDTALTLAAWKSNAEAVNALVKAGEDINVKNKDSNTALTLAAWEGNAEAINALVKAGADINVKNKYGNTALTLAAYKGNVEAINALVKAGADINVKNKDGDTALIKAVYKGYMEAINALIKAKVDINAKNKNGDTALVLAIDQSPAKVVNALIQAGANINTKYDGGITALMFAAYKGNIEAINALIKAGANVNVKSDYQNTALIFAIEQGHAKAINALIKAGADVNVKKDGDTALMYAIEKEYAEIVIALIKAGADVNAKNQMNETALIKAASKGNAETINALIDAGANVKAKDLWSWGMAAIDYAHENKKLKGTDALKRLEELSR